MSVLVVAAGQAAPVLYPVEEPLDDVAVLVVLDVVADWPAAAGAPVRLIADEGVVVARRCRGEGRDLPRLGVPTPPSRKTSTPWTLRSRALAVAITWSVYQRMIATCRHWLAAGCARSDPDTWPG